MKHQITIGMTPEVNEKNDDFCVWQFNLSRTMKKLVSKCNYLFARIPDIDPEIERELREINAEFEK